jgi:DNA mismatch endonuclease (patch repair protein)
MADVFTRAKRSEVMAAIRAKNTRPEIIVRRLLHMMGYRFRLHISALPGQPDIVIPKIRTIVQVKGCFWHGHHCLGGRIPAGNRHYWAGKIEGNRHRDRRNERRLRAMGWRVKTIWECSIRKSSASNLFQRLDRLTSVSAKVDSRRISAHNAASIALLDKELSLIRNRKRVRRLA